MKSILPIVPVKKSESVHSYWLKQVPIQLIILTGGREEDILNAPDANFLNSFCMLSWILKCDDSMCRIPLIRVHPMGGYLKGKPEEKDT